MSTECISSFWALSRVGGGGVNNTGDTIASFEQLHELITFMSITLILNFKCAKPGTKYKSTGCNYGHAARVKTIIDRIEKQLQLQRNVIL